MYAYEIAQQQADQLTTADYVNALKELTPSLTQNQLAMLTGHATAPGRALSMEALSKLVGYPGYQSANMQYGKMGTKFATYFGIHGLQNQTQALATLGNKDTKKHWQWVLRSTLADALLEIGLVEPAADCFGAKEAAVDINLDPQTHLVSETTRQALINARVGQGSYRKRMFRVWNYKCAVTSCPVEAVLVASHAKPWADCSNKERLDEYNGILLSASIDKLFDSGLISFADSGAMLISKKLRQEDMATLGLSHESRLAKVHPRHIPYLKEHRQRFGFE